MTNENQHKKESPFNELPAHLGGGELRCHNDRGALRFMVDQWGVKSILDIGCGRGCVIKDAIDLHQMEGLGIDGVEDSFLQNWNFTRDIPFVLHDYTKGAAPLKDWEGDLCWTVEFLEHVEEKYIPNFMVDVQRCKYVICTHARPGDGGRHHVNEQNHDYWIKAFDQYGFDFDARLSIDLRAVTTMKKKFMRRNGLVFIRRDSYK